MIKGIEIQGLNIDYGEFHVIENLSFSVMPGEIVTLYGPSGCGKSTVIKALLGQLPFTGEIIIDGEPAAGYSKPVGYVPQENDLLPWKTVLQNVGLWHDAFTGIKYNGLLPQTALETVDLVQAAQKRPSELSGGMQRRAVLARAMATNCELMLFDEAFISIERALRRKILVGLRSYIKQHRITCVSISHDLEEAVFMSDRLLVLTANPTGIAAYIRSKLPESRGFEIFEQKEFVAQTFELVTST